jgi:hypothetical protein
VLGRLLGPEVDALALGADGAIPEGVRLRRSPWLTRLAGGLLGGRRRVAAVTLGRTIVLAPDARPSRRLLRHELAHVRQWRDSRWFPVRYVLAHVRHGYVDNPYEIEARAAEATGAPASSETQDGSSR